MTKSRDIANSTSTLDVDGGTIKLDGNYPVGTGNVALGDDALRDGSLSGGNNTAIGHFALYANTSGSENTSIGRGNLDANTTGIHNTALGSTALSSSTTGSYNTALGSLALNANTTASSNTAVGYQAGNNNNGGQNTFIGYQSALDNTTGGLNVSMGYRSMYENTTGASNVALGHSALLNNTTASGNVAIGDNALRAYQTGGDNVVIGRNAGYTLNGNGNCTFLGRGSGFDTTGGNNTFVGYASGSGVTSGAKNTIVGLYNGNQGGLNIRTSSNNIVLSDGDGNPKVYITPSGSLWVGRDGSGAAINTDININHKAGSGNGASFVTFRYGSNVQIGDVYQASTSSVGYATSSDYRLKENVVDLSNATTRLKQLKPKRFSWIDDGLASANTDGFIAHEVMNIVPEAVRGTHNEVDDDGNAVMQGIDQSKLVPLLVKTIQELEARITALEA